MESILKQICGICKLNTIYISRELYLDIGNKVYTSIHIHTCYTCYLHIFSSRDLRGAFNVSN